MQLKNIMWYSILVNSSTMQHSTWVYQARVPLKKKKLHSTWVYRTRVLCDFFFIYIKGTRAWYTWVLCCMVLEFTKLEYHIIFFNCTNSNSAVPQWQNWWGTLVSETRVLEKVVLCHLFSKQRFFAKNFQKMWYLAIWAKHI